MRRRCSASFVLLLLFLLVPALASAQAKPDLKAAKAKYDQLCVTCHGASGKGDGPAAAALNPKPGNFTDCKAMAKETDETLIKIIKDGSQSVGRSPLMPPWGTSLKDADILNLVAYVRGFCKKK
jgi:mono/diheme cytochrome c family protein